MNATRRRIEQRNERGILTGTFETTLTDAELQAQNLQITERRAALAASGAAILQDRRREAAKAEALEGIGVDADAREHLRAAHQGLAAARDELARRREVTAAADAHVARCQAAHDAARRVVDGIAARAAAAIREQLENGRAPSAPTPTRAAAEAVEAARADLEHAEAAQAEVRALARAAEAAFAKAEARVKEAARAVIKLRVSDLSAEIDELIARREEVRGQINVLLPT